MAVTRALVGVVFISRLALACSCLEPPDLCSRLQLNMVAFVGHPISTVRLDQGRTQTTFQIDERLWGVLPPDLISVDGAKLNLADRSKSWFVLAGRRTDSRQSRGDEYYVDFACCMYGLLVPPSHAWVKEFRDNIARLKRASIKLEVKSNYVVLPGLKVQISGPGYFWQGISREAAFNLNLPPGEYSVDINNPHFTLAEASRRVSVLPGACTAWSILAEPTSSISGRIMERPAASTQDLAYSLDGEVDPGLEASLWDSAIVSVRRSWYRIMGWGDPSVARVSYSVVPDSDGRFQVHALPGKYRMGARSRDSHGYVFPPPIPATYYPGVIEAMRATEIVVRPGSNVGDIYFGFPNYGPTRRVEIWLVNEDGSPVPNRVIAHTGKHPADRFRSAAWNQKLTDSHGHVTFDLWQSLDYELHISGSFTGDSPNITSGGEPVNRKFIVHPWLPSSNR